MNLARIKDSMSSQEQQDDSRLTSGHLHQPLTGLNLLCVLQHLATLTLPGQPSQALPTPSCQICDL